MVEFEWDDDKRRRNLEKHGLDFIDARRLFDGRPVYTNVGVRESERRYATTGYDNARYYTVIWTRREGRIRIISFRRARLAEEREHRSIHG